MAGIGGKRRREPGTPAVTIDEFLSSSCETWLEKYGEAELKLLSRASGVNLRRGKGEALTSFCQRLYRELTQDAPIEARVRSVPASAPKRPSPKRPSPKLEKPKRPTVKPKREPKKPSKEPISRPEPTRPSPQRRPPTPPPPPPPPVRVPSPKKPSLPQPLPPPQPARPASLVPKPSPPRVASPKKPEGKGMIRYGFSDEPSKGETPRFDTASAPLTDIYRYLRDANLSLWGTEPEVRARAAYYQAHGNQPFVDLTGEEYYDEKGRRLIQGMEYNPNEEERDEPYILGEGELRIQSDPNDPALEDVAKAALSADAKLEFKRISPSHPFLAERDCSTSYQIDFADLDSMDDLWAKDPRLVYVFDNKRCYYLPSLFRTWESGFTGWDKEATRVSPQYPSDPISHEPFRPNIIREMMRDAPRELQKETPVLSALVYFQDGAVLARVYDFILIYAALTAAYDWLPPADEPEMRARANRRDLHARKFLDILYTLSKLDPYGYRRYDNIPSRPGKAGVQIFYQCVLTAAIRQLGFSLEYNASKGEDPPEELRWVRSTFPCMPVLGRDPCRRCVDRRIAFSSRF